MTSLECFHFNRCAFPFYKELAFFSPSCPPFLILHFKADNASQSVCFWEPLRNITHHFIDSVIYMLHTNKSVCYLSNYFISLKWSSPLFMAAVVRIFSEEQIQSLGFFFACLCFDIFIPWDEAWFSLQITPLDIEGCQLHLSFC